MLQISNNLFVLISIKLSLLVFWIIFISDNPAMVFLCTDMDDNIKTTIDIDPKFKIISAFYIASVMYLDINKKHPIILTSYSCYKDILNIVSNNIVLYIYKIGYNINYFLFNNEYNTTV